MESTLGSDFSIFFGFWIIDDAMSGLHKVRSHAQIIDL